MLTLVLTRHGLTDPADVMLGGQLDVPLTAEGRRQAEALAARLAGIRIDRIISSPMLRALETARTIAAGRSIEVDERLRELSYGRWEGLRYAEIEAGDPELRERWEADPAATSSPGGESGADVAARVESFLQDLLRAELGESLGPAAREGRAGDPGGSRRVLAEAEAEAQGERRVLVVAHGTLNRILLCVALGLPVRDYRRRFAQDRTNLTALQYEPGDGVDGALALLLNDVGHLRAPGVAPWG